MTRRLLLSLAIAVGVSEGGRGGRRGRGGRERNVEIHAVISYKHTCMHAHYFHAYATL